nr:hypothetical protein [Tanacetum cinerariifolium]
MPRTRSGRDIGNQEETSRQDRRAANVNDDVEVRNVPPPPPFVPPVREPMVQERWMETRIGQEISRAFEARMVVVISTKWIKEVELAFRTSKCPNSDKVGFASILLRDQARHWWDFIEETKGEEEIILMTWERFKIAEEFLTLKQGNKAVEEITAKFFKKMCFSPLYASTKSIKMKRYLLCLQTEIREFVVTSRPKTLAEIIDAACERGIEIGRQTEKVGDKRK